MEWQISMYIKDRFFVVPSKISFNFFYNFYYIPCVTNRTITSALPYGGGLQPVFVLQKWSLVLCPNLPVQRVVLRVGLSELTQSPPIQSYKAFPLIWLTPGCAVCEHRSMNDCKGTQLYLVIWVPFLSYCCFDPCIVGAGYNTVYKSMNCKMNFSWYIL